MPMTNPALGRRILNHIEAHPEKFDMRNWQSECGTRACLAGYAVLLSGRELHPGAYSIFSSALDALGLTLKEYVDEAAPYDHSLFYAKDNAEALDRFRVLVEKGEAEQ